MSSPDFRLLARKCIVFVPRHPDTMQFFKDVHRVTFAPHTYHLQLLFADGQLLTVEWQHMMFTTFFHAMTELQLSQHIAPERLWVVEGWLNDDLWEPENMSVTGASVVPTGSSSFAKDWQQYTDTVERLVAERKKDELLKLMQTLKQFELEASSW